jgi:hypothetical protein
MYSRHNNSLPTKFGAGVLIYANPGLAYDPTAHDMQR